MLRSLAIALLVLLAACGKEPPTAPVHVAPETTLVFTVSRLHWDLQVTDSLAVPHLRCTAEGPGMSDWSPSMFIQFCFLLQNLSERGRDSLYAARAVSR